MPSITIPHNYSPREYQIPLFKAMDSGYTRGICIWHRRAGKDKSFINVVAKKMFERVGSYYYFFPSYNQGKKILWNGRDKSGFKFTDHIPKETRKRTVEDEMIIELKNGSLFQVIGTDKVDSIVGTNPIGVVFSEYSLQDPSAWDYIRPILAENGGWALFNFTPRGANHALDLYNMALKNPDRWFVQKLTADETHVLSPETLAQERQEMADKTGSDALYMQEYFCSFEAPIQGAYYATQMLRAMEQKRICSVPWDPELTVETIWDLGVGDATAIGFRQTYGKEVRYIDYYENSGEGLAHYAKVLKDKPYVYSRHIAPHDINVTELGSGVTRKATAQGLGINFEIAPRVPIEDGVDKLRSHLEACWFDAEKCKRLVDALRSYHKEFDEERKIYKSKAEHDWSSHPSDMMRYAAVSHQEQAGGLKIVGYEMGLGGIELPVYDFG